VRLPIVASIAAAIGTTFVAAQPPAPAVDFGRDVQPIFREYCYSCHSATIHQNGFRLDRRADAFRGGTGSVIGRDSAASHLYRRIAGIERPQMPPSAALKPEQIEIIKHWIDQGAEWPDDLAGDAPPRPTPPLMRAVLDRDAATVRRLLDEHADPNATNDVGATALMWAATNNDVTLARLLLDRGANVNAKSDDGRTPLLIATRLHAAAPLVKLLLDAGADPSATAPGFGAQVNPLLHAAFAGEAETMRLLIAKGADVKAAGFAALAFTLHADCRACFDLLAPSMDQQAISLAPLVLIPPESYASAIRPLIDRGADVNTKDGLGRSVLMRLVADDGAPADLVQLLIARGADVNVATADGASALSFAEQRGHTPIVDLLLKAGAKSLSPSSSTPPVPSPAASPREAVERALPPLQHADVEFFKKTGCVACHNNSLTAMAVSLARSHGVRVDEDVAHDQADAIGRYVDSWRERALLGIGVGGEIDTISAILVGLSAEGYPADAGTDAWAGFVRRQQMPDGHWLIFAHRPPIESNDIQVTATSMRALQVYAPKRERADADAAIKRAAAWIQKAQPRVNEERAYQLLGLAWSQSPKAMIQKAARALIAGQRADGGWSQLPTLASDAYATGQALVALEQSGAIPPTDTVYKRGVEFLRKTQLEDGSWFVKSRAIAIQPYFESGFPHGRNQFISAAATDWAVMALAAAVRPGS
jgi:ankyrin repeat protein